MKLEFHYTFLIIAISFIITGYLHNLLLFTSIIIIHELGHYIVAKIINLNPIKITIYPFGGITKLDTMINTKINKELLVSISGIVFQAIYYLIILFLYKQNLVRTYIFNLFNDYHHRILIFNLLPIHPLDGSKILNLLLSKVLPYKQTLKLNIIISIITIIIVISINYYKLNYTLILIGTIIIDNIVKYYENINYLFNRFLLERYLYKLNYKTYKTVNQIDSIYQEKSHIIKGKTGYITEKQALMRKFSPFFKKKFDIST